MYSRWRKESRAVKGGLLVAYKVKDFWRMLVLSLQTRYCKYLSPRSRRELLCHKYPAGVANNIVVLQHFGEADGGRSEFQSFGESCL